MAYQEGLEIIGNGEDTLDVVFPVAFGAVPDVIMTVVQNTIDVSPLFLDTMIVNRSTTGFTVNFSASTDSVNYKLSWLAGSASVYFDTTAAPAKQVSKLTEQLTAPLDTDGLVGFQSSPKPVSVRLPWELIYSLFCRYASATPENPASDGGIGSVAVDEDYAYIRTGTAWGRFPLNTTDWTSDDLHKPVKRGVVEIADEAETVSVVFDSPFTETDPPHVFFSLENTEPETISMLYGVITARSLSGFTVTLNAPAASANYKMVWKAEAAPE